jgi:hypothetical protein
MIAQICRRRILLLAFAAACGGAADSPPPTTPVASTPTVTPTPTPTPPPTPAPLPVIVPQPTSYANAKNIGATQLTPPPGVSTPAFAWADFNRRGVLDLFVAQLTYAVSRPITEATASRFEFWRREANGTFTKSTLLPSDATGCIHPRKSIVADFNKDGRPDVFVACHGYDQSPYPGERNKVVLSSRTGLIASTMARPTLVSSTGRQRAI